MLGLAKPALVAESHGIQDSIGTYGGCMTGYGLSSLEIKGLLERAFLPDLCRCISREGDDMDLTLISADDPSIYVRVPGISLRSLNSSRAIADLVAQVKGLLAARRETVGLNFPKKMQK